MSAPEPQTPVSFLRVGEGTHARQIAVIREPGAEPGLIWLQGFKSEMISVKAAALSAWTRQHEISLTRFDYSGHGQSEGAFEDGTIGQWLEETKAVFSQMTAGPQILVGSSMGGYLALLLTQQLMATRLDEAARIHALVLIAPAWDMTAELMWPRFSDAAKRAIDTDGVWHRPSQYGDPYPITRALIADGRHHLIGRHCWDPGRPIRILHGRLDPDVPFSHTERLMRLLTGRDQKLIEIPDGEHRLSRPQDLAALFAAIAEVRG